MSYLADSVCNCFDSDTAVGFDIVAAEEDFAGTVDSDIVGEDSDIVVAYSGTAAGFCSHFGTGIALDSGTAVEGTDTDYGFRLQQSLQLS